ncbi:MAG: InlB B-repeat-containing protein [Treponema sp.]|nr:InlB B-repeat-containing protein [Treponema sp.]
MRNKNLRRHFVFFTALMSIIFLFSICHNPIMEGWWETPSNPTGPLPVYHIVDFNTAGGIDKETGEPFVSHQLIVHDGNISKIPVISREHFGFAGWYTNTNRSGSPWNFETDTVSRDLTLFANWAALSYNVNFETNGAVPLVLPQTLIYGARVKEPPSLSNPGQGFGGWFTDAGFTQPRPGGWDFAEDTVNRNFTLYAKWHSIDYTVIFHPLEGEPNPPDQHITSGGKVVPPSVMSRQGYAFGGWFIDDTFAGAWDFASVVESDLDLYAKWLPLLVSVRFIANGGTPIPDAQAFLAGTPAKEPLPITRPGYAFGGWWTTENDSSPSGSQWNFAEQISESMTLYARWLPIEFTVTFAPNGGTPPPPPQSAATGVRAQEPLPLSRPDHGFGGWFSDEGFTQPRTSGWDFSSDTVSGNLTLYARWEPVNYFPVNFEQNGGQPLILPQNVASGSNVTRPGPMVRTGFSFGGWFDNSNFLGDAWNFTLPVTEPLTLYAKWEQSRYTVNFVAHDGDPPPQIQYILHGSKVTIPAAMTREIYSFGGWFTNMGIEWNFAVDIVTEDLTLHARWDYNPPVYVVHFVTDTILAPGTRPFPPTDQYIVHGVFAVEPPPIIYLGYAFDGWFTMEDFDAGNFSTPWHFTRNPVTRNLILKARWVERYGTVYFQANEGEPAPERQYLAYRSRIKEPLAMTRANHSFGGWFANPRFEGLPWNFANGIVNTEEVTLYAKWVANNIPPIEIATRVRVHGVFYVDFAGNSTDFNGLPVWPGTTPLTSEQINGNNSSVRDAASTILKHLNDTNEFVLQLSGHANPTVPRPGESGFNQEQWDKELADLEKISRDRAQSVIDIFLGKNIPEASMINMGYSDRLYGDGSHGSLNRTVEIIIVEILPAA